MSTETCLWAGWLRRPLPEPSTVGVHAATAPTVAHQQLPLAGPTLVVPSPARHNTASKWRNTNERRECATKTLSQNGFGWAKLTSTSQTCSNLTCVGQCLQANLAWTNRAASDQRVEGWGSEGWGPRRDLHFAGSGPHLPGPKNPTLKRHPFFVVPLPPPFRNRSSPLRSFSPPLALSTKTALVMDPVGEGPCPLSLRSPSPLQP